MAFDISSLLPNDLPAYAALILIIISALTSGITATFGLGGGAMLIAVMSIFMPAAIVVPVHGAVQLGSNSGRAILQRKYIQWQFALWFITGSAIGAIIGGSIAAKLPDNISKLLIGLFLLYIIWLPKPNFGLKKGKATIFAGIFTAFIGMITGIGGPLVISFLRNLKERRQIIATHAMLMSAQNIFKITIFTLFGFVFSEYFFLILAMVLAGFIGTYYGTIMLDKMSEQFFRTAIRWIIALIALNLLYRSITSYFGH